MTFGSGLSRAPETGEALKEALASALPPLDVDPSLVILFATPHHLDQIEKLAESVHELVRPGGTTLGAVAEGVIGGAQEADDGPGLSVWAAELLGVEWECSHLTVRRSPEGVLVDGWEPPEDPVGVILIADPYTFPGGPFAAGLEVPVIGGMANTGRGPGGAALIKDGQVFDEGAISLTFGQGVEFMTVVSQGCRPIGEPAVVTGVEGHEITQIGGATAYDFLRRLLTEASDSEKRLIQSGLHLGIAMDEYRAEFGRGDFLIRGVMAVNEAAGTVTVGERVEVGQTVQFQVRDPVSADDELRKLVGDRTPSGGVLLFSCNGRGRRFFGEPDHDAGVVSELLDPPAVAGFFAAGEFGPVGGSNFVHGYTASLVVLTST